MTVEILECSGESWLVGLVENALDEDPVNTESKVRRKQQGKYKGYPNKRKIIG